MQKGQKGKPGNIILTQWTKPILNSNKNDIMLHVSIWQIFKSLS